MPADEDETWAGLLRAANAGDETAYRHFLLAIAPVLRGLVRNRASFLDPADREDVVQEVLLAIHTRRHTWRSSEPLRPWLYAVTRYKLVDALRARGRRTAVSIDDFAEVLPAPAEEDPALRRDVERVVGRLDHRSAAVVRAIGIEGASIAETGERMALSEGAVRVALHRALKKLAAMRIGQEG